MRSELLHTIRVCRSPFSKCSRQRSCMMVCVVGGSVVFEGQVVSSIRAEIDASMPQTVRQPGGVFPAPFVVEIVFFDLDRKTDDPRIYKEFLSQQL